MVVIGAGGLAKEVIEVIRENNCLDSLFFFDDLIENKQLLLYNQFQILKSKEELVEELKKDNRFIVAIGNSAIRAKYYEELALLGGEYYSIISLEAKIASFDTEIANGNIIMHNSTIANGSRLGKGVLVYHNVQITHDCTIGDFTSLSPGATLLGGVNVGKFSEIGANATILPKIKIGSNVIVGAGAVVTKDIPDNAVATGIPAKIIKTRKYEGK